MKRVLLFLISLLLIFKSRAQEISRQEADSMMRLLHNTKPGVNRIDLLLSLAQFHIFKKRENQIDLDSAAAGFNEASRKVSA